MAAKMPKRRTRLSVFSFWERINSFNGISQISTQTQIATAYAGVRLGKEEQQNERALTFIKKSKQAISLDVNGVSQQFRDKGPLQRLIIDLDGVFDKVPGYIAVGIARLRIHLKHELGKIHFRIFHQLFCLDPVHDDGLGIKTVWRPAPHIVAFGTPGIESVLYTHLDAFAFKLGLIKRVIVYKLDRISRSIVDFAKLMELFKQYDVEFVSCTEKFDTSTPMGRAMLNICIVFAQLERESIQMRVQDAFYSRCTKGYYMRGRTPYGFDTEPIVMDGIKTKKLVENAEMDFAELMYQMYAEPGNSYGDISRYFAENDIKVYDKSLKRGFIAQLLRNPVYVQADMDIYEYFKAQGVKIESPPEMFTGDNSCYLYQGREGEEPILVIAPHQGRIPSQLWLTVQRKLSQNSTFQNGRKCHNTWLAGKIKCGRCGYALASLNARNGVTYLRCKQRADNKSCEGAGTLTAQSMEAFVYGEMVKKMRKFHTLKGGKEQSYNPKLTAARVALAKTESEIEKLLDTLSGANPLLLQYANTRIEELDAERQKQLRLVADLTANSVSASQIDSITGYLDDWESVSFDDKRKVVDILISQIDATSESVTIHWKI